MSEQQKLFASLSGALVAHLIFFLLVFGFLSTRSANSSSSRGAERPAAEEKPREITVLMSELMEQVEVEPAPPVVAAREFVTTDLNAPEAEPPSGARFESDRNTSAASARLPDETQPQDDGPTLAGKNPLPHLTLANRDYTEGDKAPANSPASASTPDPATASPARPSADSPPSAGREGADDEDVAPAPLDPGESPADRMKRPESDTEEALANTRRSFVNPKADAGAPDLGPMTTEEDRLAKEDGTLAGRGVVSDAEKEKSPAESAAGSDEMASLKPVDAGFFSDSFSPEERQNVLNGSLSRPGQDAVGAEATALGRYKKSVRDAISEKWHRYKQDNADFVTWGILKLQFSVDRDGRVKDLQITKNEANAILAEFSLKAIREVELPPMPEDVAVSVGAQGLVIQYDIIIY